jgi:hypothetical protein
MAEGYCLGLTFPVQSDATHVPFMHVSSSIVVFTNCMDHPILLLYYVDSCEVKVQIQVVC